MEEKEVLYKQFREEFYQKYRKSIIQKINNLEKKRKELLKCTVLSVIGCIVGFMLLFIFAHSSACLNAKRCECHPFYLLFCIPFMIWYFRKCYENEIKLKIMPVFCQCFENLKWVRRSSNEIKFFKKSSLLPEYNFLLNDDNFEGEHLNVKFWINEIKAFKLYNIRIRGISYFKTCFSGVVLTIEMNKNFTGNTVIRPNKMLHNTPTKNLHHTVLEDIDFEKKFDVFTDDDVEARYLLTTSFMERLNKIQVTFNADNISAAFYKGKLYIALHTKKDLFKLKGSLIKKIVFDEKQFFTMFEEILSILMLIDYFKLNQKIGL